MGCNEVSAAVCLFFLVSGFAAACAHCRERRRVFGLLTACGVVFFCLAYGAPGNFARAETIGAPWRWRYLGSALGGIGKGFSWFFRTPLVPALLFCALLLRPRWKSMPLSAGKRLALMLAMGCALFFGEYLLVYVTSKRSPYARINNAIYHGTFVFGLVALGVLFWEARRFLRALSAKVKPGKALSCLGVALMVAVLLQPTVALSLYNYATGEFAAYRATWLTRLALLPPKEKAADVELTLPALRSRPYPLVFRDLEETQGKHQWIAEAFAKFYGLRGVRVAPSGAGSSARTP